MSFRNWIEATEPYQPQDFNPALMTWDEFWQAVNPKGKYHSSDAYDWDLSHFRKQREEYPELLFRKNLNGITFEFRVKKEDKYEGQYVKDNDNKGNITYYTREELPSLLKNRYEYSFGVFDGDQQVAIAQDEWGCVLVSVAREYRGFGIAAILNKLAWDSEPGKDTGGCTPGGARMVQKTYQSYVRDYLQKGMYSHLVQQGVLTTDRVKQILASAKLQNRQPSGASFNMQTNNPADFLLYGQDGCFVLYNRRLQEFLQQKYREEEQFDYWMNRFIKGTSFAGGGYVSTDRLYLHQLGGDTPQITKFMLQLALSFAAYEKLPLHIYDDDLQYAGGLATLNGNLATIKGQPVNYTAMIRQEAAWRRSFDRYDEFRARLLELAESKYR